jgi:hypothetical protein
MVAAEVQKQALVSKSSEAHTEQTNSMLEQLRQVLGSLMITRYIIFASIFQVRNFTSPF